MSEDFLSIMFKQQNMNLISMYTIFKKKKIERTPFNPSM